MISLNKAVYFIMLMIFVSLNAQLTKIEIDIKGNYKAIIDTKDTSLELTYLGKIADIDAAGQITYDLSGRVMNIGSTQISYNESGNIAGIGPTQIGYDLYGKVASIGQTQITYDFSGRAISIGSTKITYDLGRVTGIGAAQITYDWHGRITYGGNFISNERIAFKLKFSSGI
ncbi:MAG: hypothetical protein WCS93_02675 [Candidatus Delongbacteria bacterium]